MQQYTRSPSKSSEASNRQSRQGILDYEFFEDFGIAQADGNCEFFINVSSG